MITGIVPDGIRERCAAAARDALGAAAVGVRGASPKTAPEQPAGLGLVEQEEQDQEEQEEQEDPLALGSAGGNGSGCAPLPCAR